MAATLATRLSAPLSRLDRPANAITDAMNRAVPWLWWPLAVPDRAAPMPAAAHSLYVAHGIALAAAARRAGLRLRGGEAVLLGAAGWLWFTGAWDRRALRDGPARGITGRGAARTAAAPGPPPAASWPARDR